MAIQNAIKDKTLVATGFCLWCNEKLPAEQRFCDSDCRDDFEKRNRR